MRLRRLDLTRYGKFTDRSLDFGDALATGPDFHIIYGPNEAGKSTTMQGWLDLLYGIPTQSRMDFLHPYGTMRLGAVLESGADVLELIRTKGRNNTLTDAAGNALPEAVVQGLLGGIDRAGYEAMFSLDDETLEKGGESILSSQGDLGQMLFTASSGLADMGRALDGLRASASGFFKPGGRTGGLADLKKVLEALDQQIAAQDIGARDFAVLAQVRDQAQAALDAAQEVQDATVAQLHLVERQVAALPLVTRLNLVAADLGALPDLPPLPQGWVVELADLLREHGQTAVRIEAQAAQMEALRAEMEAATDDPAMLALEPAMVSAEALKSDYDGAVRDLPARRAAAEAAQALIDDLLRQLGAEGRDPAALLPPAPVVANLRSLMERQSGVAAALDTARQEAEAAERRLADLTARLDGAGAAQTDLELLAQVMQSAARGDPEADLDRARSAEAAARDRMEGLLARLAPWRGDGAALAGLALPDSDRLQGWRQDLAEALRMTEQARVAGERVADEAARITAQMQAAVEAGHVSLEDAAQVRAARESLWAAHRASLSPQTAAQFEAALRRDDQVTAALARAQTEALARAGAQDRLALLTVEGARHAAEADLAAGRIAAVRAALALVLPLGLDPATTPEGLEDWMRRREAALEGFTLWQAAARDLAAAEGRCTAARAAVAAALTASGQDVAAEAPLSVLTAQARVLLDRASGQAALIEAREVAVADLERRSTALARAEDADQGWQDDWRAACARTHLDEDRVDVATMNEVLDLLRQLDRALDDLRGLQDRIAKMQTNRAAFEVEVAGLLQRLDLPQAETMAAWAALRARLRAALDGQTRRREAQGKLAEGARAGQVQRDRLAGIAARLDEMCAHFGCDGIAGLQEAVDQAQRRQVLLAERDTLARDICEGMGTDRLTEAVGALDGLDRPVLAADRDRLRETQARQAQDLQRLYADLQQAAARIEAVGGDDAVARLQAQRQTVLLQIAEEARAFLRHRLGIVAVDHALQRYRDSHRSAMMQRASDAFRTITRGEYSGLAAQPEGEREVLVALAAGGASKLARDLSKGTRFQLYLALRVAGYHEIAGARALVPFIADDIMETFDDDRAAETFALLAQMAGVGQVIYLTHHRHLCGIAQAVCPAVRIHALG